MHRHEGVRSSPRCHSIGIAEFNINIPAWPASHAVCRRDIGLFQATHRYIQKALLHSNCPSVYRLSVFHVCGTLSTQRKSTGTVTIFSTLLSYKVTKCRQRTHKGGIIELGQVQVFVFSLHYILKLPICVSFP